ncbi:MAG: 50S ribosomal protein L30 [Armatimonadota bacterium]
MSQKLRVTLIRSVIGRKWDQKRTVRALGLRRIGSSRIVPDNPAIRGMIRKVSHLVTAEVVDGEVAPVPRRPSVVIIGMQGAESDSQASAAEAEGEAEKEAE